MRFNKPSRLLAIGGVAVVLAVAMRAPFGVAQDRPEAAVATVLDQKLINDAKEGSEIMTNLAHLSDVIGPRLTGSANLKRANDWAAERMISYGLSNVQLEPWELPVGWERGTATAKLIEPNTGWHRRACDGVPLDVVAEVAIGTRGCQPRPKVCGTVVWRRIPCSAYTSTCIRRRASIEPSSDSLDQ